MTSVTCISQIGTATEGQVEVETVDEIHPSFAHKDRLGYLRRKILVANGLMPEKESKGGGDKFMLDLVHWARYATQTSLQFDWPKKGLTVNNLLFIWWSPPRTQQTGCTIHFGIIFIE